MLETFDTFVLTCDKSIQCCDIFQKVYTNIKHPRSKVYFLGYTDPTFELLDDFYFISLNPHDPGPKCSRYINNFFKSYNKDNFILTVDDHIPIMQKNEHSSRIYNYILKEGNVGRYGLTHDVSLSTQHSFYKKIDDIEYISVNGDSQYKLSLVWSVWNRNFLLKNLIDDQDLWEFETIQNDKCKLDEYKVYSTAHYKDSFVDTSHLYKRGKLKKNTYMYSTYSKKIIDQNYIDIIDKHIT
jgi:hypothetical protein